MANGVDSRLDAISNAIRVIPNFPKEGIMFQDVTTLLLDPAAFQHSVDIFYEHYKDQKVDVIAGERNADQSSRAPWIAGLPSPWQASPTLLKGILCLLYAGFEARGLIFGAPLALKLKVPFVPLRKPGKLPGT